MNGMVSLQAILLFLIKHFGWGAVNAELQQIQLRIQKGELVL